MVFRLTGLAYFYDENVGASKVCRGHLYIKIDK